MTLSTFQMKRETMPWCLGINYAGGAECLPCIETGCPSAELDGNDYCNVCWTESLLAAPCVKVCFKRTVFIQSRSGS